MMNKFFRRRLVFIILILLAVGAVLFTLIKPKQVVYKAKYSYKPVAKQRPKELLNSKKKLSDLLPVLDKQKVSILIEKSAYKLTVIYEGKQLKSYAVVLGSDPVNDKQQEGDGRTPEGNFKVKMAYPHRAWSKFIWLDYPNEGSWKKFNKAKAEGLIKNNASIGGEVGIHGVPEGDDSLIDEGINWTAGCISLKRKDVDEIYTVVQKGTVVRIKH